MTSAPTPAAPDLVDASTLRTWLHRRDRALLLDVRSPAEFETARLPGSINVPLPLLERHAGQLAERLHRDVVLVCQSGNRARQAQQRLAAAGDSARLHVLDGGVNAYEKTGGELERGRARWSLERQVRLVAGALVLAGTIAGLRTPRAGLLAAGVGAGLTVSALTDTCTMGRVLAALPYNRGPRDRTAQDVLDQLPPVADQPSA